MDIRYETKLMKIQDTLYFARKISDKKYLYRILQDEVKPVLLFKGELSEENHESLALVTSIGDNLYFFLRKDGHMYEQYYNLKTKTFSNWNFVNDIDKGPDLLMTMYFKGKYMGVLHSSDLARFLKHNESDIEYNKRKCKFPEREKMFKEFALKGENDNPWLMVLSPAN